MDALAGQRTTRLDLPPVRLHRRQVELVTDLGGRHGALHVLLVSVDENRRFIEVLKHRLAIKRWRLSHFMCEHGVKLLFDDVQPLPVRRVDNENNELRLRVVGGPRSPQTLLSADVPHEEVYVAPDDFFDI